MTSDSTAVTTLITGATGLEGFSIVTVLLAKGRKVLATVRETKRASAILPDPEGSICGGALATVGKKPHGIRETLSFAASSSR